ncbi:hypothetical protein SDJN03_13977, partial [Cucurbita argyrosperma subsp. sororia]
MPTTCEIIQLSNIYRNDKRSLREIWKAKKRSITKGRVERRRRFFFNPKPSPTSGVDLDEIPIKSFSAFEKMNDSLTINI